jgi:hypothetical protein
MPPFLLRGKLRDCCSLETLTRRPGRVLWKFLPREDPRRVAGAHFTGSMIRHRPRQVQTSLRRSGPGGSFLQWFPPLGALSARRHPAGLRRRGARIPGRRRSFQDRRLQLLERLATRRPGRAPGGSTVRCRWPPCRTKPAGPGPSLQSRRWPARLPSGSDSVARVSAPCERRTGDWRRSENRRDGRSRMPTRGHLICRRRSHRGRADPPGSQPRCPSRLPPPVPPPVPPPDSSHRNLTPLRVTGRTPDA